jgi:hypothetical protein
MIRLPPLLIIFIDMSIQMYTARIGLHDNVRRRSHGVSRQKKRHELCGLALGYIQCHPNSPKHKNRDYLETKETSTVKLFAAQ